ncbi:DUF433 domain-containing protein [Nisaea sp.]|uniref:DUF433 domain-containing protein n=1 Tax=Nisaea sp. TaxID=2024842 RepID=UPI0032EBC871
MTSNNSTNIVAFSEEDVIRLTGLSLGQLRAWDRRGFFEPQFAYEDRHVPHSRVYSFQDVVGLRTISVLMKNYKVSLQQLRKVAGELIHRGFDHWTDVRLYVLNKQVHFREPTSDKVEGIWDGQLAMLPVIDVIHDVENRIIEMNQRSKSQSGKVEKHKYVARNASVISGTRIPTASIRRFHEAGYTISQICHEYPTLTEEDVAAAISYEEGLAKSA